MIELKLLRLLKENTVFFKGKSVLSQIFLDRVTDAKKEKKNMNFIK